MVLDKTLQVNMKVTAEKIMRLDNLNQIIIASKIDALYERQMIDESERNLQPRKIG